MRDLQRDELLCGSFHYETPFSTPTEFSEEEIADYLRAGYHVGSHSARAFIETYQPDLCSSGHMHEAPGEDAIGRTLLLNPGMLAQGGYVTVTCTPETLTAHRVPGQDTRHYSTSPVMPSSL